MKEQSLILLDVKKFLTQTGIDPDKLRIQNVYGLEEKADFNQVNVQPSQKQ